jgi:hypothetical protein
MTPKKLDKLRGEILQRRRAPQKAADLEGIARRLGRKRINRGKHPMWESQDFPKLYVLSIPDHGSKDLPVGTRNSILDQLEDDILAWEELIQAEEEHENDNNTGGADNGTSTETG